MQSSGASNGFKKKNLGIEFFFLVPNPFFWLQDYFGNLDFHPNLITKYATTSLRPWELFF